MNFEDKQSLETSLSNLSLSKLLQLRVFLVGTKTFFRVDSELKHELSYVYNRMWYRIERRNGKKLSLKKFKK